MRSEASIKLGVVAALLTAAIGPRVHSEGLDPARDENLAYAAGVQTYINGFPMMDLYRTLWETSFDPEIGMDPATRFDWDKLSPQTQRGLERATTDAHRIIAERMPRAVPIINNWQLARLDKRKSGDPVIAAAAAMLGLLWNPAEISTYDVAFVDGSGKPLDGNNRNVLRFDPPPPINAFWSVTMYSADNQLFVANPINRYSFGDRTNGAVYGEDGSLEVFLQHEEPTDPKERANWLPAPKGRFYLVTRHYSPQAAILTGDWTPPAVTKR